MKQDNRRYNLITNILIVLFAGFLYLAYHFNKNSSFNKVELSLWKFDIALFMIVLLTFLFYRYFFNKSSK